jgi:hypothetical protein
MKARECVRSQKKLFPSQGSNRRADSPAAAFARENGLKRRPRPQAWPPVRDFTFVVKMYGPNVAQGWEQYSLKNSPAPT